MDGLKILSAGDSALFCRFSKNIDLVVNRKVMLLAESLEREKVEGVIELMPSYSGIMIYFNPIRTSFSALKDILLEKISRIDTITLDKETSLISLPVCYEIEFGPDLPVVAEKNKLSINEVIEIHSSPMYRIYMLGFTPGFPYLGGMDDRIITPRKSEPRLKIEAGSVGIAGSQTGIYPLESPGGWQIIGKTPLKLFDTHQNPASLLKAGMHIKFQPIDRKMFDDISNDVANRSYTISLSKLSGE